MARLQAAPVTKAAARSGKKVTSTTAAALRPREALNAALGIQRAAAPGSPASPRRVLRNERQRSSARASGDVPGADAPPRHERSSSLAARRRAAAPEGARPPAPLELLAPAQTGRKRGPLDQSWMMDEESQGSDSRTSDTGEVQVRYEPGSAAKEETERELLNAMKDSVDAFNAIKPQSNVDNVYAEMKLLTEGLSVLAPGMAAAGAAVEDALRASARAAQDSAQEVSAQVEKHLARIEALSEKRRELYKARAKGRADWTARVAKLQQLNADKVASLEKDFHKRQAELRHELSDHSKQRGGEMQLRAAIEGMLSAI